MEKKAVVAIFLCLVWTCSPVRKAEALKEAEIAPVLAASDDVRPQEISIEAGRRDSIKVTDETGKEYYLMNAVKDSDGEMIVNDVISASIVVATSKNVAERHGKVDIRFDISVPPSMVDSRWQLRIFPKMFMLGDTLALEPLYITGEKYRNNQLRGYDRYRRFLEGIVSDSTLFVNMADLEIFLRRNIPQLYAMKTDSSFVSDERWTSVYGVGEKEAVEHYTNKFRKRLNKRKISRKDEVYKRLVKAPIVYEGLRLDTVVTDIGGGLCYHYVQTVHTRPQLRKVEVELESSIYEADRLLAGFDGPGRITFYISSLSTLADETPRYKRIIIERRVDENAWYNIAFKAGSSVVDSTLGTNSLELERISRKLAELDESEEFAVDSITVEASCSPEGSWALNSALSESRSKAVCGFFASLMDTDSLRARFRSSTLPENWPMLETLVASDTLLLPEQKECFRNAGAIKEADRRERSFASEPWYAYMKENIYPRLRTVRFGFHLHRRGMVKDTIWTRQLDTTYMKGVQAIKDRDYPLAVFCLRPYEDWNTALAYCAQDYNASALGVLEKLPREPRVDYLMAILHSRRNEEEEAVQCYLNACYADHSYIHRGSLDPEISTLINKYQLNKNNYENF